MAHAGEIVEEAKAIEMQDAGVNEVFVLVSDPAEGEIKHKIIANNTVNFKALSQKNPKIFGLLPTVYYPNFRFMQKIAAECESAKPEDVAEKYRDEINSIYYTVEIPEAEDEKPEDKKNREKRRDNRVKFVTACKKFNELLNADIDVLDAEEKKEIKPVIEKLNHKHITVDDIVATISTNIDLQ